MLHILVLDIIISIGIFLPVIVIEAAIWHLNMQLISIIVMINFYYWCCIFISQIFIQCIYRSLHDRYWNENINVSQDIPCNIQPSQHYKFLKWARYHICQNIIIWIWLIRPDMRILDYLLINLLTRIFWGTLSNLFLKASHYSHCIPIIY